MNIVLLRQGNRAVLLPAGRSLLDCPAPVRRWLGIPVAETTTHLTLKTPMPGISVPAVLNQLQREGFCALDLYGVVREFEARPPSAPDCSATDLLREVGTLPSAPRG